MKVRARGITFTLALVLICMCTVSAFAETKKSSQKTKHSTTEVSPIEENFEFKGVTLGDPLAKFKDDKNYDCHRTSGDDVTIADAICYLKNRTIAGKDSLGISLGFYNDMLCTIHILIEEKDFNDIIMALHKKYGKSKKSTGTVTNQMGAEFENVTYTWQRKKAELTARRYSGSLDKSMISFNSENVLKEYQKRMDEKAKEGAGDL